MATVYNQVNDPFFQGAEASVNRTSVAVTTSDTVDFTSYPRNVTLLTGGTVSCVPLKNSDGVNATDVLTFTGQPATTQTVTIGSKTYTFQTVLTNVDGNVFIGATFAITLANLQAALTLGAGSGSAYAAATTANTTVAWLATTPTTMSVAAILPGTTGNSLAATTTVTGATWAAATLLGGVAPVYAVFGALLAGYTLPFRVRRINAAGTSATFTASYD
jgi:hypothetical protein